MEKPRVLALNAFYLPGYKGGGSIRALVNLVGHLQGDFTFVVGTSQHDLKEAQPYPLHDQQTVIAAEGYDIRYLPGGLAMVKGMRKLLQEPWDLIYLNSAFTLGYAILPMLINRWSGRRKVPLVIAPRGEFMAGALASTRLKYIKKKIFLFLSRLLGHFSGVTFHATSAEEEDGIKAFRLGQAKIVLAPDLPPRLGTEVPLSAPKGEGRLRIVFVSRIDPKKNLHVALEVLARVTAPVAFDIIGPIANESYWDDCQQLIKALPESIQVRHLGAIPHTEMLQTLAAYDLFFFPTQAENNGYVILEALLAGCPVLLSDRTPWLGLAAKGVGRELPLEMPGAFSATLDDWAALTPTAHAAMKKRAQDYGRERLSASEDVAATRFMLLNALQ